MNLQALRFDYTYYNKRIELQRYGTPQLSLFGRCCNIHTHTHSPFYDETMKKQKQSY